MFKENKQINRLTKEEYEKELNILKYKFAPETVKQLKKAGYLPMDEDYFIADIVEDSSIRGMFNADTVGDCVKAISLQFIIILNKPIIEFTKETFNDEIKPFFEAAEVVYGLTGVSPSFFFPYNNSNYDPNTEPDKYTIEDFVKKRAFFAISSCDAEEKIMQLIITPEESIWGEDAICVSLKRYLMDGDAK